MSENRVTGKLTDKDLRRYSLRYALCAQACQNYESAQSCGVIFALGPFLEEWYKDQPDVLQEKFRTHLQYFNCQTYCGAIINAATLAIEEDTENPEASNLASSLKTSLMGPFSGIGDALFNTIPKVVMGALTAYAAVKGEILTSLLMILIFTPLTIFIREKLIHAVYRGGADIVVNRQDQLNNITQAVTVLGIIVIGAMIPSLVKVSTPIEISIGEATQSIQAVFDKIVPYFLPILTTVGTYFGLTKIKGMNTIKMVWIMLALGIILSYFKIIA